MSAAWHLAGHAAAITVLEAESVPDGNCTALEVRCPATRRAASTSAGQAAQLGENPVKRRRLIAMRTAVRWQVIAILCPLVLASQLGCERVKRAPAHPQRRASPAIAEPARASSETELVYFATEHGLLAVSWDGTQRVVHASDEIFACVHDETRRAVWLLTKTGTLVVADLLSGEDYVLARGLPALVDALIVDAGASERGRPPVFTFGAKLALRPSPALAAEIDCEHELGHDCWKHAGSRELSDEYRRARDEVVSTRLLHADVVSTIAGRAERSPKIRLSAKAFSRGPVRSVPSSGCEYTPEACGRAIELPATPYWLVLTGDSLGDLYHQRVELFDPKQQKFLDLLDPRVSRDAPTTAWHELQRFEASDTGVGYALEEAGGAVMMVSFARGLVFRAEMGSLCGFDPGGYVLPHTLDADSPFAEG